MAIINVKQIQAIENEMIKEIIDILNRNGVVFYLAFGSVLAAVRHHGPIPWDSDMDILVPVPQLQKAISCLEAELSERFIVHGSHNDKNYSWFFPRVALSRNSSFVVHVDIFPVFGLPNNNEDRVKICKKLNKCSDKLRTKSFRKYIGNMTTAKNIAGKLIEMFCSPLSCRQLVKKYYKIAENYSYDNATHVTSGSAGYGLKNILPKDFLGTPVWVDYCDFKVPIPQKWDEYLKHFYKNYMEFPPEEERNRGLAFTTVIDNADYEKIKEVIEE